ncbi:predicted protein [Histoplasma capsulatum var. duboisii H88]|uniref:Predicted protein n=2 Tax=Ajellomyces capsulatus TaxID=5037 RepID=F0UFT4_AJEC8|nr:predicted protein [Histoplasma capsulatum H143]EGC44191.1 predicted protein [Histoplasma capsulatum var. duboisii H88]
MSTGSYPAFDALQALEPIKTQPMQVIYAVESFRRMRCLWSERPSDRRNFRDRAGQRAVSHKVQRKHGWTAFRGGFKRSRLIPRYQAFRRARVLIHPTLVGEICDEEEGDTELVPGRQDVRPAVAGPRLGQFVLVVHVNGRDVNCRLREERYSSSYRIANLAGLDPWNFSALPRIYRRRGTIDEIG